MRAIVFLNGETGEPSFYKKLVRPGDSVFCADGGAEHARRLGLIPDLILGDIDSASKKTMEYFESRGVTVERYSPFKDETDSQILLRRIDKGDFKELLIAGALGKRIDHVIANIALLERFYRADRITAIVSQHERIEIVKSKRILSEYAGATVSLLSIDKKADVSIKGFRYSLADGVIKRGDSLGMSNVVTSNKAHVEVKRGKVLMIITEDK